MSTTQRRRSPVAAMAAYVIALDPEIVDAVPLLPRRSGEDPDHRQRSVLWHLDVVHGGRRDPHRVREHRIGSGQVPDEQRVPGDAGRARDGAGIAGVPVHPEVGGGVGPRRAVSDHAERAAQTAGGHGDGGGVGQRTRRGHHPERTRDVGHEPTVGGHHAGIRRQNGPGDHGLGHRCPGPIAHGDSEVHYVPLPQRRGGPTIWSDLWSGSVPSPQDTSTNAIEITHTARRTGHISEGSLEKGAHRAGSAVDLSMAHPSREALLKASVHASRPHAS